jgi:hypothetical protein
MLWRGVRRVTDKPLIEMLDAEQLFDDVCGSGRTE